MKRFFQRLSAVAAALAVMAAAVFDLPEKITAKAALSETAPGGCDTSHTGMSAWTDTTTLPTSGSYYLDADVNVNSLTTIKGSLTLCLNGHTITAVGKRNIFTIDGGTLTLCDCSSDGTGKLIGSVDGFSGVGGGISVMGNGTFNMNGGTIVGCTVNNKGGGVYLSSGSFIMNGGTISGNKITDNNEGGGGVYVYGGIFTMNGGTISGNEANYGGGVYINSGSFIMNGGTILDNTSKTGGGVYVNKGSFTMNGGTISGNIANFGGVYVSGTFTINGKVDISGNTKADNSANNVYLRDNTTITIGNGFSTDSNIGVNTKTTPTCSTFVDVTKFADGVTAKDISANFTPDINGQNIVYNDGNVQLMGDHSWGTWKVTSPTTTATGTKERVCSNDNTHKETETLPVLTDSKWTKKTETTKPTITETGSYTYTSTDYGDVTVTVPKLSDEVWTKTETTKPTITTGGSYTYTSDYGTVTATVPKLSDPEVWTKDTKNSTDPTINTDGEYTYTSDFGTVTATVPKLTDEVWTKDETTKPTLTETGSYTYESADYGTVTVTVPELSNEGVWTKDDTKHIEPTEEDDGRDVYTSEDYGEVTVILPGKGHTHVWGDWNITADPTETTAGTAERACSCGEKETKTDVPALNDATVWTKTEQDDKDVYTSVYGTIEVAKTPNTPGDDPDTPDTPDTPDNPFTPATPVDPVTPDNSDNNSNTSEPSKTSNSETSDTSNSSNFSFTQTTEELIDAILSTEERAKLGDGDNIRFILQIENTDPAEDKAMVESVLAQHGELAFGQYIDITLFKIVNEEKTQITKTNRPIGITFDVPEDLRGQNRVFSVVRVHDGETTVLPDLDDNANTVTIETDKFSTYALVYSESASAPDNSGNPSTGIAVSLVPITAVCAVMAAAVIRKKK